MTDQQAQHYPRVADYIASVPWLIEDGYLDLIKSRVDGSLTIEDVAQRKELAEHLKQEREHSPAAVAARAGTRIEKTRRATMREGGVAILPITGPIFRYANLFTAFSGATSTAMLSTDFNALLENDDVRAILLSIDSPGGEAFGIGELASMIALGAQQKPVVAYVSGMGASAAYWLASAAQEIVADATAILGSIGVVLTVRDMKRAEKQRGIDSYEIVSTQSPRKRLEPSSEEGRAALQETADAMAEVFIESIAQNRGVNAETVLANFGQGGVMVGRRAVAAGLADRISSFETVLSEMVSKQPGARKRAPLMKQEGAMPDEEKDDKAKATAATDEPPKAEPPKAEPPKAEQKTEPKAAGQDKPAAGDDAVAMKARIDALEAENKKLAESNQTLATSVGDLQKAARTARFEATAKDFIGDRKAHVEMLEHLATTAGEDSKLFTAYVTDQRAHAEQVRKSGLFGERGKDAETAGSVTELVNQKAAAIAKERGISMTDATAAVFAADPGLYAQYTAETTVKA